MPDNPTAWQQGVRNRFERGSKGDPEDQRAQLEELASAMDEGATFEEAVDSRERGNPFDQFDDAPVSGDNVFNQFDTADPAAEPSQARANVFDKFDPAEPAPQPEPKERSIWDVAGNIARGVGERALTLAGGLAQFGGEFSEALPQGPAVVWDEGKGPRFLSGEEYEKVLADEDRYMLSDLLKDVGKDLQEVDLGYVPETTWENVKDAEGVIGTTIEAAQFALEQGAVSVPDMIGALARLPAYILSRAGEIANNRAKLDGREEVTEEDLAIGGTTAGLVGAMERFGAERVLGAVSQLNKSAIRRIVTAGFSESLTEAIQEPAEYAGERIGQQPMTFAEAGERSLAGAVGGLGAGVALRGGAEVAQSAAEKVRGKYEGRRAQLRQAMEAAEAEARAEAEAQGMDEVGLQRLLNEKLMEFDAQAAELTAEEQFEMQRAEEMDAEMADLAAQQDEEARVQEEIDKAYEQRDQAERKRLAEDIVAAEDFRRQEREQKGDVEVQRAEIATERPINPAMAQAMLRAGIKPAEINQQAEAERTETATETVAEPAEKRGTAAYLTPEKSPAARERAAKAAAQRPAGALPAPEAVTVDTEGQAAMPGQARPEQPQKRQLPRRGYRPTGQTDEAPAPVQEPVEPAPKRKTETRTSDVFGEKYQVRERSVPLESLRPAKNPETGETQGVNEARLGELQGALQRGEELPEILVRREDDGGLSVVDGHHRLEAMKREGVKYADVFRVATKKEFDARKGKRQLPVRRSRAETPAPAEPEPSAPPEVETKPARVRRNGPGSYVVGDDDASVDVMRVELDDGKWWLASANYARDIVTDPLPTQREAVQAARDMLAERQRQQASLQGRPTRRKLPSRAKQEKLAAPQQEELDLRPPAVGQAAPEVVDAAANEAATSPANPAPEPTEAQKSAGNYKKGHLKWKGLDISIENPKGSTRSGTRKDGSTWSREMKNHYGYIRRTESAEGPTEQMDVFLGDTPNAGNVYIIDQVDQQTGEFDEHKVMVGFKSRADALRAYKANYEKGWKVGPVTEMPVDEFKTWVKQPGKQEPLSPKAKPKAAATEEPVSPAEAIRRGEIASNIPKSLKSRLERDPRIRSAYKDEDGYWVHTAPGYWSADMEAGTIHERTVKEVLQKLKNVEKAPPGTPEADVDARADTAPGETTGEAMTVEEVEQAIAGVRKALGPNATVRVEQFSPFPGRPNVNGAYRHKTDEVILVADNLKGPEDAVRVFLHETVGHKGLRYLLRNDTEYRALLNDIYTNMDPDVRARLEEKLRRFGYKAEGRTDQKTWEQIVADEFVARSAEQPATSTWLENIVAVVRRALRRLGLVQTWTDKDIELLLRENAKAIREGAPLFENQIEDVSFSRRSRAGRFRRIKSGEKAGQYVGSPSLTSPAQVGALAKKLAAEAKAGEPGRMWYERSGDAILKAFGAQNGHPEGMEMARKFAGLLAIYSPNNSLSTNTTMAIKAWNQYQAGQPINVAMKAADDSAMIWMAEDRMRAGEKVNNFYNNLMRQIYDDPQFGATEQGVTVDIWMMRALGYESDVPTQAQYEFAQEMIHRVADRLGWEPQQVQAAVWVAAKARKEGKVGETFEQTLQRSKRDFMDMMLDRVGQLSWEAEPSTSSRFLPEMHDAPLEQKIEFQLAVSQALTNDSGTDLLARELGLLQGGAINGPAAWETNVGHGGQLQAFFGRTAKGVDDGTRKLMNGYSDILGYLLKQDAVAWHVPIYGQTKKSSNGVHLELGRAPTHEETKAIYGELQAMGRAAGMTAEQAATMAPIATPSGLRFILDPEIGVENVKFHGMVQGAAEQALDRFMKDETIDMTVFRAESELRFNDWQEAPDGESYRQRIDEAGFGDTLGWAERVLAPRIRKVYEDFAQKYGWTVEARDDAAGQGDQELNEPPVRDDGRVELTHYSRAQGLTEIDPSYHGRGIAGEESKRKRANPDAWVDRTYYGIGVGRPGGYEREVGLGTEVYTASVHPDDLYDLRGDPLGIRQQTTDHTMREREIFENGYKGYWVKHPSLGMVAAVFDKLPVEKDGRTVVEDVSFSLRDDEIQQINENPQHPASQYLKLQSTVEQQIGARRQGMRGLINWSKDAWDNNKTDLLAAVPLRALEDYADPRMTAVPEYTKLVNRMAGLENELQNEMMDVLSRWKKFARGNYDMADLLSGLMHESTLAGVDPSKPFEPQFTEKQAREYRRLQDIENPSKKQRDRMKYLEERKLVDAMRKRKYRPLRNAWNSLTEDGQQVYKDVRDLNAKNYDKLQQALIDRIEQTENVDEGAKSALISRLRREFESGRVDPYFPLGRFGKHWAVAKTAPDEQGNQETLSFAKFENPSDIKEWRAEWEALGAQVYEGTDQDIAQGDFSRVDPAFAAQVTQLVRNVPGDEGQRLADDIWQAYLKRLPEMSARKAFIHRKGIAGFTGDAMRSFADSAFHTARQIAKSEYGYQMEQTVQRASEQARDPRNEGDLWAPAVAGELYRRHAWVMEPRVSSLAARLTGLGTHWFLGLNPSSAAVNLTQTWLVGAPVLASYNDGKMVQTYKELTLASAQMVGTKKQRLARLTEDEAAAFAEFDRIGLFDRTRAQELIGVAERGIDVTSKWHDLSNLSMAMFQGAEQYNREVTALAAYRMARSRGETHENAILEAERVTWDSHFDYSAKNRPRIMQGDIARVALLFRNYAANVSYRVMRDLRDSLNRDLEPSRRKAAMTRAVGVWMHTMLYAGASGLPLVWGATYALDFLFGDEDEPIDPQAALRLELQDWVGVEQANWIMDGALDAGTGMAISNRVSLSNLWFMEAPYEAQPGSPEWLAHYGAQLAGPLGSGLSDAVFGAQLVAEGQTWRGIEKMAPIEVRNGMKALRYFQEGVKTLTGEDVVAKDRISAMESFAQAAGFTPTEIALEYETARTKTGIIRSLDKRRERLRRRYQNADTPEARAEVLEDIRRFDDKNPDYAIERTLRRSMRSRAMQGREYQDGVRVPRRLQRRMRDIDFTEEDNE